MSNVITIEYSLIDANSKEQLDTNVGSKPLEFISGMGQIIPGLEKEIENLQAGEKVDVLVQPADAYGEYDDEAVQRLPKEQFAGIDLVEGMTLYGTGEDGQTVQVIVKGFTEDEVTIDYNHPLAGKTLMFSVTIIDVRAATQEELQTGIVGGVAAASGCCGGGSCGSAHTTHSHDEGGCCSTNSNKEQECCENKKHSEEHQCCGGHDGEGCKNS